MRKRKSYTTGYKREAVRLIEQPGASVPQIAKGLGVSSSGVVSSLAELLRLSLSCLTISLLRNSSKITSFLTARVYPTVLC
jgi:hypothetical protein